MRGQRCPSTTLPPLAAREGAGDSAHPGGAGVKRLASLTRLGSSRDRSCAPRPSHPHGASRADFGKLGGSNFSPANPAEKGREQAGDEERRERPGQPGERPDRAALGPGLRGKHKSLGESRAVERKAIGALPGLPLRPQAVTPELPAGSRVSGVPDSASRCKAP